MIPFDTSVLDTILLQKHKTLEPERQRLLKIVRNSLYLFKEKYHIKEAYIIDSLLSQKLWSQFSDIDVAVSGASEYTLKIMKELEEKSGKEVDVIDLEFHPHTYSVEKNAKKVEEILSTAMQVQEKFKIDLEKFLKLLETK
ncbi:MAG: hypothetical protein ACUVQP_04980 [Bacteroidales bacterium]